VHSHGEGAVFAWVGMVLGIAIKQEKKKKKEKKKEKKKKKEKRHHYYNGTLREGAFAWRGGSIHMVVLECCRQM